MAGMSLNGAEQSLGHCKSYASVVKPSSTAPDLSTLPRPTCICLGQVLTPCKNIVITCLERERERTWRLKGIHVHHPLHDDEDDGMHRKNLRGARRGSAYGSRWSEDYGTKAPKAHAMFS